jgi:anthranilate/para-aminobenzoate synthase component II
MVLGAGPPKSFLPLVPGWHSHKIKGIIPTTVSAINCHQPLLLVSCSLRVATDMFGINVKRLKRPASGPLAATLILEPKRIESTIERAMDARKLKSTQYQYSLLRERVLKSVYFLKTACTASVKFIAIKAPF